jgi:hypothetical protein
MFKVLDILVDDALVTTRFACDLGACQGACCTMPGGRGAPVTDEEAEMIREATPAAMAYLSERNRGIIRSLGGTEGSSGNVATRCIDDRDCVYVYYEGTVAKCAIERAHFNGQTPFRKPVSCHLFPIRSSEVLGGEYLRYERIDQCDPALKLGRAEGVPLYKFLKEAITRAYGKRFYNELVTVVEKRLKK